MHQNRRFSIAEFDARQVGKGLFVNQDDHYFWSIWPSPGAEFDANKHLQLHCNRSSTRQLS